MALTIVEMVLAEVSGGARLVEEADGIDALEQVFVFVCVPLFEGSTLFQERTHALTVLQSRLPQRLENVVVIVQHDTQTHTHKR